MRGSGKAFVFNEGQKEMSIAAPLCLLLRIMNRAKIQRHILSEITENKNFLILFMEIFFFWFFFSLIFFYFLFDFFFWTVTLDLFRTRFRVLTWLVFQHRSNQAGLNPSHTSVYLIGLSNFSWIDTLPLFRTRLRVLLNFFSLA